MGRRDRRSYPVASAVVLLALALTSSPSAQATLPGDASSPLPNLTIIAPAAPGGGWDQLAREMQREIDRQQLVPSSQVENIPGAAGTIGLAQIISARRGDGRTLLVNGLVMLGAILWNDSPVSLAQATPIARMTGEYEIVAVPADSPHRTMTDLVAALRANPTGVSWGGGSAGGTDHILAGLIVSAAGVDPRRTNYIAFSGGGEAVTALLGGQVTAGISGYSEFSQFIEAGRLRAIGISSPHRVSGLDVPTMAEQGLAVELQNWRAVMAPPGLSRAQRQALDGLIERLVRSPSWQQTVTRLGWTDAYLAGPPFEAFLDAERVRVGRIVARLRGGGARGTAGPAGEWVFPALVLVGCAAVLAFLIVQRRTRPVDAEARTGPVWRVTLGLTGFVALLHAAGFIAAGTLLFACTASAFGSRRWARDAVVGGILCATVWVAFTKGLGVALP